MAGVHPVFGLAVHIEHIGDGVFRATKFFQNCFDKAVEDQLFGLSVYGEDISGRSGDVNVLTNDCEAENLAGVPEVFPTNRGGQNNASSGVRHCHTCPE